MKAFSRILAASALVGVAGCSSLPGANLGGTFTAESFLDATLGGGDNFTAALAREYQALAADAARNDVNWYDATAYVAKGRAAAAGSTPAPWSPAALGLSGEVATLVDSVVGTITANADRNPAACARAQALWDNYLEELSEGDHACTDPAIVREALDEALAACGYREPAPAPAPAPVPVPEPVYVPAPEPVYVPAPEPVYVPAPAPEPQVIEKIVERIVEVPKEVIVERIVEVPAPPPPVVTPDYPLNYTIYFGFDRTDLTAEARQVINEVVEAFRAYAGPLLNIIGHADTSGSKAYNTRIAEQRANNVANALESQGVPRGNMNVGARSELDPAVNTGDGVREALNRRVTIQIVR